uniref:Cyclin n=1 Tax=Hemiselmis andersenii TaxID=464988 RepID=A0A6U4VYC2_HEMAN|mmetsp:Transcript_18406/g.42625  ORF Transcript_18406/g.42625 Transcript_18406/m.42625 type:complete len:360 (+) Transcript_18406:259-1338(+)|eukprot:CAMPEP_0114127596 /NCGR_PEP_ID=MMETSP0043_2-20121206/10467_1 /TAXON_ID=464988 /ORGANISM="Hemiselmis andersenii, Strain CCMP644" /LENGTH=359 /DNA_ID=CAMNT_0001220697 /DNA_START=247 /DNA_END=1326 /DNA_ORIENTATION=-
MTVAGFEVVGGLPVAPGHSTAEGAHGQSYSEFVRLLKDDADKTKTLIPAVISLLEERIEHNDALVLAPGSRFLMNITIKDYMKRIEKYSNASPCCYVVGLIFLERLKRSKKQCEGKENGPLLTSATYQRLVVTAIMVAAKFLDDYYHSNKHWALIAGLPTKELNELEVNFLDQLGYRLHIQREEYDWFAQELYDRAERESMANKFSEFNLVSDDALSMMSTPPTSALSLGPDSSHHQEQAQSKAYAIPSKAPAAAAAPGFCDVPPQAPHAQQDGANAPAPQRQEHASGRRASSAVPLHEPVCRNDAPLPGAALPARVYAQVHQGAMPVQQQAPMQMQWPQAQAPMLVGGYGMPVVQWGR